MGVYVAQRPAQAQLADSTQLFGLNKEELIRANASFDLASILPAMCTPVGVAGVVRRGGS